MPFEPPPDPRHARRNAIWRWVSFAMATALVLLVVYLGWIGYQGSQLFAARDRAGDCRTPGSASGWTYAAINYPIASDDDLQSFADRLDCPNQGPAAGDALTASDGTRLAGWYIPAGRQAGPTAATVVLAHADGANKSEMLPWADLLHADYNLVIFDFRNHGQSSGDVTTMGVREAGDLRAVLDWLEKAKRPTSIAVLGVSMGGAAAINEAAGDSRVKAVILDSTHATLANAFQARLDRDGYPLSLPGAWSILLGGLLRTGEDMSSADPVQAIARYRERPVLIITGGSDRAIGPSDAADLLAASREVGGSAELDTCTAAAHAQSITTCSSEYAGWLRTFLGRILSNAS
ncbi:MAG: alpha/beta fold hydrolase [Candidatus Limnocylindria bacterium]